MRRTGRALLPVIQPPPLTLCPASRVIAAARQSRRPLRLARPRKGLAHMLHFIGWIVTIWFCCVLLAVGLAKPKPQKKPPRRQSTRSSTQHVIARRRAQCVRLLRACLRDTLSPQCRPTPIRGRAISTIWAVAMRGLSLCVPRPGFWGFFFRYAARGGVSSSGGSSCGGRTLARSALGDRRLIEAAI